jgi:hypothetical protein
MAAYLVSSRVNAVGALGFALGDTLTEDPFSSRQPIWCRGWKKRPVTVLRRALFRPECSGRVCGGRSPRRKICCDEHNAEQHGNARQEDTRIDRLNFKKQ